MCGLIPGLDVQFKLCAIVGDVTKVASSTRSCRLHLEASHDTAESN